MYLGISQTKVHLFMLMCPLLLSILYYTFGGNEANLSVTPFISFSKCSSGKTLVTKPLEYASAEVILRPKRRTSFAYNKLKNKNVKRQSYKVVFLTKIVHLWQPGT